MGIIDARGWLFISRRGTTRQWKYRQSDDKRSPLIPHSRLASLWAFAVRRISKVAALRARRINHSLSRPSYAMEIRFSLSAESRITNPCHEKYKEARNQTLYKGSQEATIKGMHRGPSHLLHQYSEFRFLVQSDQVKSTIGHSNKDELQVQHWRASRLRQIVPQFKPSSNFVD